MHPEIDRFANLKSPIHRWDPRIKIPALFILILSIALVRDFKIALVALVSAIGLLVISRIPPGFVFLRLRWVVLFLAPFFIILPITVPGDSAWNAGFPNKGFFLAALIFTKALAIVIIGFPMFGTTPFNVSMKALAEIRLPQKLIQIILFCYRYIFVYLDQLRRMRIAMSARGFQPKTNIFTLRVLGDSVGMLLVMSFEQTERIYQAMCCRGYTGAFVVAADFRLRRADVFIGVLVLALASAFVIL